MDQTTTTSPQQPTDFFQELASAIGEMHGAFQSSLGIASELSRLPHDGTLTDTLAVAERFTPAFESGLKASKRLMELLFSPKPPSQLPDDAHHVTSNGVNGGYVALKRQELTEEERRALSNVLDKAAQSAANDAKAATSAESGEAPPGQTYQECLPTLPDVELLADIDQGMQLFQAALPEGKRRGWQVNVRPLEGDKTFEIHITIPPKAPKLRGKRVGDMIVIEADDFLHILHCMANQKYVGQPPNENAAFLPKAEYDKIQAGIQSEIDATWRAGMDIYHGKDALQHDQETCGHGMQPKSFHDEDVLAYYRSFTDDELAQQIKANDRAQRYALGEAWKRDWQCAYQLEVNKGDTIIIASDLIPYRFKIDEDSVAQMSNGRIRRFADIFHRNLKLLYAEASKRDISLAFQFYKNISMGGLAQHELEELYDVTGKFFTELEQEMEQRGLLSEEQPTFKEIHAEFSGHLEDMTDADLEETVMEILELTNLIFNEAYKRKFDLQLHGNILPPKSDLSLFWMRRQESPVMATV